MLALRVVFKMITCRQSDCYLPVICHHLQTVGIDSFDPVFGTFRAIPKATDSVVTISLEDIVFEEGAGG